MKMVHLVMTFGVFFPSVITAFSVASALEIGGRSRGGGRLIGWFFKLPWSDPIAGRAAAGDAGLHPGRRDGADQRELQREPGVHNTTWVPGHFHLTVGHRRSCSRSWGSPTGWCRGSRAGSSGAGSSPSPRLDLLRRRHDLRPRHDLRRARRAAAPYLPRRRDVHQGVLGPGRRLDRRRRDADVHRRHALPSHPGHDGLWSEEGARGRRSRSPRRSSRPRTTGWEPRLDRFRWYVVAAAILILVAYGPYLIQAMPPTMSVPGFKLF